MFFEDKSSTSYSYELKNYTKVKTRNLKCDNIFYKDLIEVKKEKKRSWYASIAGVMISIVLLLYNIYILISEGEYIFSTGFIGSTILYLILISCSFFSLKTYSPKAPAYKKAQYGILIDKTKKMRITDSKHINFDYYFTIKFDSTSTILKIKSLNPGVFTHLSIGENILVVSYNGWKPILFIPWYNDNTFEYNQDGERINHKNNS